MSGHEEDHKLRGVEEDVKIEVVVEGKRQMKGVDLFQGNLGSLWFFRSAMN